MARKFQGIPAVALMLFLILYGRAYGVSLRGMERRNRRLKDGKLALQFYKIIPDNKDLNALLSDQQYLVERFLDLKKNGLLDFKPVEPDVLKYFEDVSKDGNGSNGLFAICLLLPDYKLEVYGLVHHPAKKIPPNNVILVYSDKNGDSKPFATLCVRVKRALVVKAFKPSIMLGYLFYGKIDISHLRSGDLMISAWTVDTEENVAYQLAKTHHVRKL